MGNNSLDRFGTRLLAYTLVYVASSILLGLGIWTLGIGDFAAGFVVGVAFTAMTAWCWHYLETNP